MSITNTVTRPEQALQESSSVNGKTKEPPTESCVGTAADETEIASLAHRLWLERGCPEGSPEEDWFLAERELRRSSAAIVAPEERSSPRECD
jgi:hypothetical protein